jgi:hypothetical protein
MSALGCSVRVGRRQGVIVPGLEMISICSGPTAVGTAQ